MADRTKAKKKAGTGKASQPAPLPRRIARLSRPLAERIAAVVQEQIDAGDERDEARLWRCAVEDTLRMHYGMQPWEG